MPGAERILRVTFESAEEFQREYFANLVHGGVFIPTDEALEARECVQVEFILTFSGERLSMPGEVVHQVAVEMASLGAPAGVAVQFDDPAPEVRQRFEALRALAGVSWQQPTDTGRRRAPRAEARVAVSITSRAGHVTGHSRNLSRGGVLVAVPGHPIPVGEKVRLALSHPTSGGCMEVDGLVVREVQTDGGVSELGIAFESAEHECAELERFVEEIQNSEHTRRLGGIRGEISELGILNLLQMLALSAPIGTLTLQCGQHEGLIGFEGDLLRFARLGPASGLKALVRMLAWNEGSFEFHARLDPIESIETPVSLKAVLFDAARILDEDARIEARRPPPDARPRVAKARSERLDLSKVEEAILDLAQAGFTVQRMIDLIPEPDPDIYRALDSLRRSGVISF